MKTNLLLSVVLSFTFIAPSFANLPTNPSTPTAEEGSPVTLWPGHADWDRALLASIRSHKAKLDTAQDIEGTCPGYRSASNAVQETCWMRLISAIISFETHTFNPNATYPDTPLTSVGLMMLSRGECPNAMTERELKNPIENIKCGVRLLGKYIARGNCLHCGGRNRGRGGGTYWSTLQPPYGPLDRNGKHKYGKKNEIIALTRNYRDFGPTRAGESVVATNIAPVPHLSQYSYRGQTTQNAEADLAEVTAPETQNIAPQTVELSQTELPLSEPQFVGSQLVAPLPYSESAVDSSGAPLASPLSGFENY